MQTICTVSPDVVEMFKKFNMRKEKTIAAKILKIDKATLTVILDEEFEDTSIEDVKDELPNQQPRFIAISYIEKHPDGRISYPLIFIFLSPQGCNPEQHMMYAGTKNHVVHSCGFTKVMEMRSEDDFTDEVILAYLKKV